MSRLFVLPQLRVPARIARELLQLLLAARITEDHVVSRA
jgi:hypothetical protein